VTADARFGPPPLRPFGLVLRRDATFWHEGVRITHPRLHAHLLRSVEWAETEGTFIVRLRQFRGWLDVEETPYFAVGYDAESGEVELTDGTREPLRVETLRVDGDGALRCEVKGRWPARFLRGAQAQLLAAVDVERGTALLRAGGRRLPLPEELARG
jgi:hypothetical protein